MISMKVHVLLLLVKLNNIWSDCITRNMVHQVLLGTLLPLQWTGAQVPWTSKSTGRRRQVWRHLMPRLSQHVRPLGHQGLSDLTDVFGEGGTVSWSYWVSFFYSLHRLDSIWQQQQSNSQSRQHDKTHSIRKQSAQVVLSLVVSDFFGCSVTGCIFFSSLSLFFFRSTLAKR